MPDDAIPQTFSEIIVAGGSILWLILLMGVLLFILFLIGLKNRRRRFCLAYLGLSFLPFYLGIVKNFMGIVGFFLEIATNPMASAADLGAGIYIMFFPNLIGSLISAVAVTSACLLIAFSREETGHA